MLRAVSKPCQCSILADYLLSACHTLAVYLNAVSGAFIRHSTYAKIAGRMIEG
jgi:hypothetical protein